MNFFFKKKDLGRYYKMTNNKIEFEKFCRAWRDERLRR